MGASWHHALETIQCGCGTVRREQQSARLSRGTAMKCTQPCSLQMGASWHRALMTIRCGCGTERQEQQLAGLWRGTAVEWVWSHFLQTQRSCCRFVEKRQYFGQLKSLLI